MSHRSAFLLGHPVAHSYSPAMHNAAFAALGIDATYQAIDVDRDGLSDAIKALRRPDCMGANVTAPYKQAVVSLVDHVSDEVRVIGAVNTIVNDDGRLEGINTDAAGLAGWMRQAGIDPRGRPALVLGAGGAARASVWALADLGASSVIVLNRTVERAQELVATLQPKLKRVDLLWGNLDEAAEPARSPWRVIVNATSMGHQGAAPLVHPSCYSQESLAVELAYNPTLTSFMVTARASGARAENGLGMLLHQAGLAFERWTGQTAPMAAIESALQERAGR